MHRIAYLAFFLSGFAALLYQTVWQRILAFFGGADTFSVTVTVAAFMAGLGFGSLAGGSLADRLAQRARLLAFAAAELAVALFALASTFVFHDVLYHQLGALPLSGLAIGAILFAVLLWPTFFMGMSLPLLARALADARAPGERIAALYGWNTLGAAFGSLVTVWVLLRAMDFDAALRIGAVLTLACVVAGAFLAWQVVPEARGRAAADAPPETLVDDEKATTAALPAAVRAPGTGSAISWRLWLVLFALSGFVALSLEIVWFRVLGVFIKASSFTFGNLLAIYLGGVGFGALLGRRLAAASRRPGERYLLLQALIPVAAVFAVVLLVRLVSGQGWSVLREHVGGYEPVDVGGAARAVDAWLAGSVPAPADGAALRLGFLLYAVVPLVVLGVPTVLMGVAFAYLQCEVQTDLARLGRRVGWLQAANIVGSMLGAIVTGLLALHWLGTAGTLAALVVLGVPFAVLYARCVLASSTPRGTGARIAAAGTLALLVAALLSMPRATKLWARLHGASATDTIVEEDRSGLAALVRRGPDVIVFANGIGQSSLPFGGFDGIHTILGALPAMVHPAPGSAVVIGLGSGDTLFGVGGRAETRTIDGIEIVAPALEVLRELDRRDGDAGLRALLREPRVRHHFTDGRAFLARSTERYDIIEADALRPNSAYAGNLYSTEYFDLLRERLNPGGIAVSWAASDRVRDTFVAVFPHVVHAPGILLGSESPIPFDAETIRRRLREPFTRDYYARAGIDIAALMEPYLGAREVWHPESDRSRLGAPNRDLFPMDEFMIPYGAR